MNTELIQKAQAELNTRVGKLLTNSMTKGNNALIENTVLSLDALKAVLKAEIK
jgi:hypothetical protein